MLSRYNLACISAVFLKNVDAAIDLLEPTFADHSGATFVKFALDDPDLADARKQPRLRKMLADAAKRLGLSAASEGSIATPATAT
jgi:hypothetical protein